MKKVSIIVPIYNKEKYIKNCIESIINQTYKDIEIILINDGSTDNSRNIIEEYAIIDDRIKVINTENKGAGSARNKGLEVSTGDYISFIDADDIIVLDYIESMSNAITENNADMVECCFKRIKYSEELINQNKKHEFYEISNIDKLMLLYGENEESYVNSVIMPNKIFKKELFDTVKYPVDRLIDDEFITYKLISKSKKIMATDDVMYGYVQSESSVMRKDFKAKRVYDTLDAYDEIYGYFKKINNLELEKLILRRYFSYCIELLEKTILSNVIIETEKKEIVILLKEKLEEKSKYYLEIEEDEFYKKIMKQFDYTINGNINKLKLN